MDSVSGIDSLLQWYTDILSFYNFFKAPHSLGFLLPSRQPSFMHSFILLKEIKSEIAHNALMFVAGFSFIFPPQQAIPLSHLRLPLSFSFPVVY